MQPLVAILFALLLGGLIGWAVWAWFTERRRRRGLLAQLGGSLRYAAGDPFDLPEMFAQLHLFSRGHSRLVRNVLHGQMSGRPVRLFDYHYETGSGVNRRTHRWQVAIVQTDLRLPGLLVQPVGRHDPLEAIFGFEAVRFEAEPFAQRFRVASEDPQFAYQFLHARLADLLASRPAVSLETREETLAVYQPGPLPPADAAGLLEFVCQIPPTITAQLAGELRESQEG